MSTLVLQAAGAVVGGALGGPVGAAVGRAVGAVAGAAIDARVFGGHHAATTVHRSEEGPRLTSLPALGSTEGAAIPRLFGRARLGGQVIWTTRFEEQVTVTETVTTTPETRTRSGGKSSGRGASSGGTTTVTRTTTYAYFANLAVGLCEGPIAYVRRVWADGKLVDTGRLTMRVHRGTEEQEADPLIVAKEGGPVPAYRGLAYVVIERMPLAAYGNRVPQLSFEVVKPVDGLATMLRAVNVIPGAGEFVLDPWPVSRNEGLGASVAENTHQFGHASDWSASLDALQALCPALRRVSLVVAWFGDDLRAGSCRVLPRVETPAKNSVGAVWTVAGLAREQAPVVSASGGRPAYGGTPSDGSVIRALRDLAARGLAVTLNPFLMMDIPAGNARPDPWTGAASQPAYPWRGRITTSVAQGRPGAPTGAMAQAEVAAFFGTVRAADFVVGDGTVNYRGPAEWTLSRQVLHCAALAVAAGGVDTLLLGSELVGLTRVASAPGVYPATAHLLRLAREVRALVGPSVKLAYAADWTEYGGHWPAPGELRFPLDPLFADPDIAAVAIDFYAPLADWREGEGHADAALARGPHDAAYLLANLAAGEAFDWFYASDADRLAQRRTPIGDGLGKPWINRPKDLAGWWGNRHVERVGGIETAATAWRPGLKPIWLMEAGCPAVDKGANAPHLFPDAKSSQDARPPFSNAGRDDLMLVRAAEAILTRFDPALPDHPAGANPTSPLDGRRMVDPARTHLWAWDARPFPAFPALSAVWGDAPAWSTGHWLNGRLEGAALDRLVAAVLEASGVPKAVAIAVDGFCDGFVLDRPLSARAALEPLAAAFGFDCAASATGLRFLAEPAAPVAALGDDVLVPAKDGTTVRLVRAQESELVQELSLAFVDAAGDYASATAVSRRLSGGSRRQQQVDLPAVLSRAEAERIAERALHRGWLARETADLTVAPGLVALEVGDTVTLPGVAGPRLYRIQRIRDAQAREIEVRSTARLPATPLPHAAAEAVSAPAVIPGAPHVVVLDWPGPRDDPAVLQSLAATASPWPGGLNVWRSADGASYALAATLGAPSTIGRLAAPLAAGPVGRWDRAAIVEVQFSGDPGVPGGDLAALDGRSALAVRGLAGWEILSFSRSDLVGPRRWRLSRLLRGLRGSEPQALAGAPAGADVVLLDGALVDCAVGAADLGRTLRWRIGPVGRDVADPTMVEIVATPGGDALRPVAPVRARARRTPAGVAITWARRCRLGGDAWDTVEVPLDEAREAYEVDILDGPSVCRTLACTAPTVLYAADAEIADFGGPVNAVALRIAQMSDAVGRGAPLRVVLPVT